MNLVDDFRLMQVNQVRLFHEDITSNAERFQQYGFSSHPHPGAECFVVFCGAASEHPVIFAVDDRRYRIKDSKPGEVVIYTDEGDTITLKRGNFIEIASKGDVIVEAAKSICATTTDVTITAASSVLIRADKEILLSAPSIYLNGNLNASSNGKTSFTAETFSINADSVTLNEECE